MTSLRSYTEDLFQPEGVVCGAQEHIWRAGQTFEVWGPFHLFELDGTPALALRPGDLLIYRGCRDLPSLIKELGGKPAFNCLFEFQGTVYRIEMGHDTLRSLFVRWVPEPRPAARRVVPV